MGKYSKLELDSAIDTCIEYLWPKQKSAVQNKKQSIIEIMENLHNKDDSEFIHDRPYALIFKITSGCNLRCKHCFFQDNADSYATDKDLSEEELFNYLKFFVEDVNIINCSLTGGEIFTTSYLMRFLEYLKSKNILVELLTNGTAIKEKDAEILAQLLNPKTDSLQISIEGPEEINDFIRGKGVFQKVKNSIRLLTKNGIKVCISMTINALNADKIDKMYDICRELKVSRLNIGRMVICNESQKELYPNNDDIIVSLARTIRKCKKYQDLELKVRVLKVFDLIMYDRGKNLIDKMLEKENFELTETNLHCRSRDGQIALFPTGDISLCYNCETDNMYIGNITKQPFYDIWNARHDKLMFKSRPLNSTCRKCKYVTLCKGGCPISAYSKYKTINSPDGNCKYAEQLISEHKWNLEETLC